jgi:hypothetical protein
LAVRSTLRSAVLVLALAAGAGAGRAAVVVSDSTMNPSSYDTQTFVQGGSITISATNSGNPGPALLQVFSVPSPPASTDHTYTYLIYNAYVYDPSVQGAVASIGFSIDKSVVLNPSSVAWGNGQGFLLEQGGRLYESDVGLAAVPGSFQQAVTSGLSPADFYLLVNPATHQADANSHPDFTAGPMRFGFYNGAGVPQGTPDLQIQYVFDNFKVSVSAVPEPASAWMWMGALAAVALRRRAAGQRQAQT